MSLEKQHVEEPEGNLSYAEAVEVLKGLQQSGSLVRVLYPSDEPDDDPRYDAPFSVQIVGTLKFDETHGKVVIEDGLSNIEFQLNPDLVFEYLESLAGHPYIGKSLAVISVAGKHFSLDIDQIVDKDKKDGGSRRGIHMRKSA
jgi:hypothetical protein